MELIKTNHGEAMAEVTPMMQQEKAQVSLLSLFLIFLKIGSTAFGGFMALISVVQNYVVDRKKYISNDVMMDGISLATILPGPIAVNVVAYAGYQIRGVMGSIVCTTAVIIPSFILITTLSYVYFSWGSIPSVTHVFNGFLPAVAAIILAAAINMGKKVLSGKAEYAIAAGSAIFLGLVGGFYITFAIIFISGMTGFILFRSARKEVTPRSNSGFMVPVMGAGILGLLFVLSYVKAGASLVLKLFVTFSGMSLLLFGGGYVFIPLIQEVVVDAQGWVSHREFIDAIALGQITPGPILISAAFIGFKLAGIAGALAATVGIFAPPAVLMLVCASMLDTIRNSNVIMAVLKGIRCGVCGMIAAAAYVVVMASEPNYVSVIIFGAALYAIMKMKLEVVWIIPLAGLAGFIYY